MALEELWKECFGETLKNATDFQRHEMRKAFFFGAANTLRLVIAIVDQHSQRDAMKCLDELAEEIHSETGVEI